MRHPFGVVIVTAAALALSAEAVTPVLGVRASACYAPAQYWHQTGSQFSDGVTPSEQVNADESDGGPCGAGYDNGNVYNRYTYYTDVQGANENDVWGQARAWVCGNLRFNQTYDESQNMAHTSPWWNYGPWNGNQCYVQFDWTVRVTSWSGQRWNAYQNETNGTNACADPSPNCPTG